MKTDAATRNQDDLPDFLIIGAQKSGTSSLHRWLAQHQNLQGASRKEIHFFDGGLEPEVDSYALGVEWYLTQLPKKRPHCLTFESTPLYLFNPLAAQRIGQLLPNAKLIVLLRNPIERAISQYFHNNRPGRGRHGEMSLFEVLRNEEALLAEAWKTQNFKHPNFIHGSLKARGRYAEQLRRYLGIFPQENILIIQSESLFQFPTEILNTVLDFLELPPFQHPIDLRPINVGNNRAAVGCEVISYLKSYFSQPNEDLFDILGRRFNWD